MNRGRISLNVLLSGAPESVELIPAGAIAGRDGRTWRMLDPEAVVRESLDGLRDVPIDWEHASEIRAPKGEPAPAAGWITALEVRNGALWGRVEWTPRGRASIEDREYRYISPAFLYDKETLEIKRLLSVGLTNSPNLRLTALNREEERMDKRILEALGLKEGVSDDEVYAAVVLMKSDVVAFNQAGQVELGLEEKAGPKKLAEAIGQMKGKLETAGNRASSGDEPSLEKFVPRADYDSAVERLRKAENRISSIETERRETEIEEAVAGALQAGKITPATADYYRAQCRTEGGLEKFKEFVKAAPTIGDPIHLPGTPPKSQGNPGPEVLALAGMLGNTSEDLEKYGG